MNIVVMPSAAKQIAALPEVAANAVAEALERIQSVPHIGRCLGLDPIGEGEAYDNVVIVRRRPRWTVRIVYELTGDDLVVHFVNPSWLPRGSRRHR